MGFFADDGDPPPIEGTALDQRGDEMVANHAVPHDEQMAACVHVNDRTGAVFRDRQAGRSSR
ncbi:MAG: hypothetical protein NVS3B21_10280 [Acidimicrobiales bacterium]